MTLLYTVNMQARSWEVVANPSAIVQNWINKYVFKVVEHESKRRLKGRVKMTKAKKAAEKHLLPVPGRFKKVPVFEPRNNEKSKKWKWKGLHGGGERGEKHRTTKSKLKNSKDAVSAYKLRPDMFDSYAEKSAPRREAKTEKKGKRKSKKVSVQKDREERDKRAMAREKRKAYEAERNLQKEKRKESFLNWPVAALEAKCEPVDLSNPQLAAMVFQTRAVSGICAAVVLGFFVGSRARANFNA
eukprot:gnl/MRDRNA2_/MRDRNA2_135726_c0_seq1.p1 gnl/MRDRNA2_/MRDRNA2_135726_c0~~gnl/MRDRNA2_/MRDRNA2_135726_c0_seq1.p1  ORF type:complete len:260 (-),score=56.70 gnl/MRDRNA2_/MRDRNA2_135726_c0_seq1:53-781(-)